MLEKQACPCGRNVIFENCCGRYLDYPKRVPTAEALMRSRYSAFVLSNEAYILECWHSSTRPAPRDLTSESIHWLSLDVVSISAGKIEDNTGSVEFVATYKHNGLIELLHETSRFIKEQGRWYYLDGKIHEAENRLNKISRNAHCPCGSGKKYKRCCGR